MLTPGKPVLPRRTYGALPLGWAAVVLLLTLMPAKEMPRTPVWALLSFDTAAHAGVFVVLAGLSWFSLRRQRRWPRLVRYAGLVVLLGSILFGGLIEVLQQTMRLGRHGDWTDLLSDAIGAALAVGLVTWWAARPRRREQPRTLGLWLGLLGATTVLSATTASVRGQDLPRARRTIAKLSSRGLHGRGYVRGGEHKAAAYLRGRLRNLHLEPLAPDFTQPFTLDVNTFPGRLKLAFDYDGVRLPVVGSRRRLRPGHDFIAMPESGGGLLGPAWPLVRLDTLVFTDSLAQQRLLRQRLSGLLLRVRDAQRLSALPMPLQQHLDSAVFTVATAPKLTASLAATQTRQIRLVVTSAAWQRVSAGRGKLPFPAGRVDARLQRDYPTQNLAALIRGTTRPDSFLIISAHYDHLGRMGRKTYFPGANDNASGVALLLELAAHYARPENRPACSVVFLLFGAEEAGLVGSRYFVAHPLIPLARIKFLVNLDLLGTGEQGATVVNGRVWAASYRRLVALNAAHRYLPALAPRGPAANSDHFPFAEAGVPAFFLYTRGGSAAYHDVHDRPAALSLAGFLGAFGLVRDFLNELGAAPITQKNR